MCWFCVLELAFWHSHTNVQIIICIFDVVVGFLPLFGLLFFCTSRFIIVSDFFSMFNLLFWMVSFGIHKKFHGTPSKIHEFNKILITKCCSKVAYARLHLLIHLTIYIFVFKRDEVILANWATEHNILKCYIQNLKQKVTAVAAILLFVECVLNLLCVFLCVIVVVYFANKFTSDMQTFALVNLFLNKILCALNEGKDTCASISSSMSSACSTSICIILNTAIPLSFVYLSPRLWPVEFRWTFLQIKSNQI